MKIKNKKKVGEKSVKKVDWVACKYTGNNNRILECYLKMKKKLIQKDSDYFAAKANRWKKIKLKNIGEINPKNILQPKQLKPIPLVSNQLKNVKTSNTIRIFDLYFELDSTCFQDHLTVDQPKLKPYSYIYYSKYVTSMVYDKTIHFYNISIQENTSNEELFEHSKKQIETLKKWFTSLNTKKADQFLKLQNNLTSKESEIRLLDLITKSSDTRSYLKRLNGDTINYMHSMPCFFTKYQVNLNKVVMPCLIQFGINKKLCKITSLDYSNINMQQVLKIFSCFTILDQFEFYQEFFQVLNSKSSIFQESGIQDHDMILKNNVVCIDNEKGNKAHVTTKLYFETFIENEMYFLQIYIIMDYKKKNLKGDSARSQKEESLKK